MRISIGKASSKEEYNYVSLMLNRNRKKVHIECFGLVSE